jgi:hypothetical protein
MIGSTRNQGGTFKPSPVNGLLARVQGERTRAVGSNDEPRDAPLAALQTPLGGRGRITRRESCVGFSQAAIVVVR